MSVGMDSEKVIFYLYTVALHLSDGDK